MGKLDNILNYFTRILRNIWTHFLCQLLVLLIWLKYKLVRQIRYVLLTTSPKITQKQFEISRKIFQQLKFLIAKKQKCTLENLKLLIY